MCTIFLKKITTTIIIIFFLKKRKSSMGIFIKLQQRLFFLYKKIEMK